MRRAIVNVSDRGRRSYLCPVCEGRGKLLTQGEVFMAGEYPAPSVKVRRCNTCGTLFEVDMWLVDRAVWRGVQ